MDRLTIPDVIDDFRAYRAKNPVWGSLHVVLEDGNFADSHVSWCVEHAERSADLEGAKLARTLLQMTRSQRFRISHLID